MGEIFSCLTEARPEISGQRIEDYGLAPQEQDLAVCLISTSEDSTGQIAKALGKQEDRAVHQERGHPTIATCRSSCKSPPR